jgi:hypothetical protein
MNSTETNRDSLDNNQPRRTTLIHWSVLMGSISVIAVAVVLRVYPDQSIGYRFDETHRLPRTCIFRERLGFDCPGCGLTRSFVHLFHGDFSASQAAHRCGWLLALAVVFQLPYRIVAIRRLSADRNQWLSTWHPRTSVALVVLLIANWLIQQFARG